MVAHFSHSRFALCFLESEGVMNLWYFWRLHRLLSHSLLKVFVNLAWEKKEVIQQACHVAFANVYSCEHYLVDGWAVLIDC